MSSIEHASVLKAAEALHDEGYDVTYLPVTKEGVVTPEALLTALRPDTLLVSLMYANNEIGTIEPIAQLAEVAHSISPRALFHTDACQAPGFLPIKVGDLGVDLMTLNSSKVYGPKGAGCLCVRESVQLTPCIPGEQFEERRGGTESVALALGFAAALEEADNMREREVPRLRALQELFFSEIVRRIPDALINGHRRERLPGNVHVTIPYVEGESILLCLDERGIACSTGSACNAKNLEPSHVLLAIGQDKSLAHGSVRFSLGRPTTREDVIFAAEELAQAVSYLRGMSSLTAPRFAPHTMKPEKTLIPQ